jgi:hypothetical protein
MSNVDISIPPSFPVSDNLRRNMDCLLASQDNFKRKSNEEFTKASKSLDLSKNKNPNQTNNEDSSNSKESNINIYRYKFDPEFTNNLYEFAKIHEYDSRHDFKDAWQIWLENNIDLVNDEVRRLTNLGYEGDILDKMFKSARYYLRKKSTEKKEPKIRRPYVGLSKNILDCMDSHIEENISLGNLKPSDGFENFCRQNLDVIKKEVRLLMEKKITDSNEIKNKIKKTYKNRYQIVVSK